MKGLIVVLCVAVVVSAARADSLNCREVGSWPFGQYGIAAVDDARGLVFLSTGSGAYVLDVSVPAQPRKISNAIRMRGMAQDFCYGESLLFAAANGFGDGPFGLEVWDVTRPDAPARLGYCVTPGSASGVAVVDNYAYVTAEFRGLRIVDVADPQNPYEVGCCSIPPFGLFVDVAVKDSFACVADLNEGLRIINVADPQNPYEAGFFHTPSNASGVAVVDSLAYLAAGGGGLRIVNFVDPQNPYELGYCETPDARGVVLADSLAYVSDGSDGLHIINVADPGDPYEVAHHPQWYRLAVAGPLGYMVYPDSGLRVNNIADPVHPHEVGRFDEIWHGDAEEVVVADSLAFVSCRERGMLILAVADPQDPRKIGFFPTPGPGWGIRDVAVADTIACAADINYGLRIINVADPHNPQEVGSIRSSPWPGRVAVQDSFAFLATSVSLRIINFVNPAEPFEAGSFNLPASDVAVADSFVYLAAGGVHIINVADPGNPFQTGRCGQWNAYAITVADGFVYAVCGDSLYIVNVTDPRNPFEAASHAIADNGYAYAVAASRDFVFLAAYWGGGLRVINVADPANPYEAGYYDTPGGATGVAVAGNLAYVADFFCGVRIVEFYGSGVEEKRRPLTASRVLSAATVVRGVLYLPRDMTCLGLDPDSPDGIGPCPALLLDAVGRKVMALKSGPNDVRALAPGVYFVSEAQAHAQAQAVRRVVVTN